ncbi:TonB-dependent receptor [Vibrio sp. SCSIO 43136]|nr:TonB-dependent receptor [Vibrio sp. SCSIO 43136]
MVVTAAGREQMLVDAPASITVIDRSQLESRSYKDLTDALRDVPGVTVTGGGSRQDISIRGMPSDYTAILVDGRKQSGRETQPSSSGGFEQDWLPPLDAIERIEIVRGPMSTLYGSDAIGGVINVITRKDYDKLHGKLRLETTLQERSESGDYHQGQVYVAAPIVDGVLSASLSGMIQQREEDDIERGYAGKKLNNYRGALHWMATDDDTVSFDFTKQDQTRTSTSGKSLPSRNSSSETNNNRSTYALSHSGSYLWGTGDSYLQNEFVENVGREITIENLTATSSWSVPLDYHFVSFGAAFESEELVDAGQTIKNKQWSLFGEDEWLIGDSFALTIGVRLDQSEQFDTHLSPRIYGVWTVDDYWTLKSGVSTGYRAPALRETSSSYVQESRGGDIYGNPNLKPEVSTNTEAGLYYTGDESFAASVTGFYNNFKDKISTTLCDGSVCNDTLGWYYINIDSAVTYGAEAMASGNVSEDISLTGTYTYTYSEQTSGINEGLPLTQIPLHQLSANANWTVSDSINSWTRLNYRGEESQPISITSRSVQAPAVTFVDLGANWQVSKNIKVLAAVYNLLDKQTSYGEYGYVEDGRRYWLALESQF